MVKHDRLPLRSIATIGEQKQIERNMPGHIHIKFCSLVSLHQLEHKFPVCSMHIASTNSNGKLHQNLLAGIISILLIFVRISQ